MAELSMDLKHALQSLTELQRRYFVMTGLEGYSCTEIAKLEGKNKSTVSRLVETTSEETKNLLSSMQLPTLPTAI